MHLAKARANKAKASTERAKAKESKDSKDSTDRTRTRARTRGRTRLSAAIVEDVDTTRKIVGSRRTPKVVRRGKHKPKSADALNLDSKSSLAEPEVEIDELSMTYLSIDTIQEFEKMQESEWIKIGVDTGAGKTAWPHSITYGTTILGDSDLTFRTATGELVKGGKRMQIVGCDDWRSRCSSTGVQTTVVCWRTHDKGWSHCVVW